MFFSVCFFRMIFELLVWHFPYSDGFVLLLVFRISKYKNVFSWLNLARFSFIFIYNLLVKFLILLDSQYLVNLYLYPAVLLIFIITLFFFLADDKWTFHRLHLITLSTFSISFSWYVEGSSANIMLMM